MLIGVDGAACRLSIIVPYMPQTGYNDDAVEAIYTQISNLIKLAKRGGRIIIIGGDWNAEVETNWHHDISAVGRYANSRGNERAHWLASWATKEGFAIANTMFCKRWGSTWTHIQNGRKRQLDYCLVERRRFRHVKDATATKLLALTVAQ